MNERQGKKSHEDLSCFQTWDPSHSNEGSQGIGLSFTAHDFATSSTYLIKLFNSQSINRLIGTIVFHLLTLLKSHKYPY